MKEKQDVASRKSKMMKISQISVNWNILISYRIGTLRYVKFQRNIVNILWHFKPLLWRPIGPKTNNINMGGSRLLQMVSESVLNPYMGLCLFGPTRVVVCLTLQSCWHNENVMSAWRCDYDIPHRIREELLDTIYI